VGGLGGGGGEGGGGGITWSKKYSPHVQSCPRMLKSTLAAPPPPPYAWKVPFHCPLRSCSPGRAARDPPWVPGPADSSLLDRLEDIWALADSAAASSCLPSSCNEVGQV